MHNAQRHKLAREPANLQGQPVPRVQIVERGGQQGARQIVLRDFHVEFQEMGDPLEDRFATLSALSTFQVLHISGGNACTVEE